jgi:RPA family protein
LNLKEDLCKNFKMEETKKYDRQVAIKTTVQQLLLGKYMQENEQTPNYLLTKSNEKIYRLNVMGIVLSNEKQGAITNLLFDDGTGKITLRVFEENKVVNSLNVGDVILSIGKLRIYNQEKYIAPEIIKKIDHLWLKLRALELKELIGEKDTFVEEEKEIIVEESKVKVVEEVKENQSEEKVHSEIIVEKEVNKVSEKKVEKVENVDVEDDEIVDVEENVLLPVQKIINLIKELDPGEGVMIEELISKSMLNDTEKLIEKMLEAGDIYQNLPGKVKVL